MRYALLLVAIVAATEHDKKEIQAQIASSIITCSSSVRLQHQNSGYFLNSQDINFGQGSGQQVVTSVGAADSYDSIWTLKEGETTGRPCVTGEPIRCGQLVRLEHA